MTGAVAALRFLTRLPLTRPAATSPSLARAAPWFPAVGLLVGGCAAGVRAGAHAGLGLSLTTATLLGMLSAIVVTGALHEDGLADIADAVGAHTTPERRREILHDPRLGVYGTLGLVFALALTAALLGPLSDARFLGVVVAGHVLGRWSILLVAAWAGRRRREGSAAGLDVRAAQLVPAGLFAAVAAIVALGPAQAATAAAAVIAAGALTTLCVLRSIGTLNGDAFGAVAKLGEISVYLALVTGWN